MKMKKVLNIILLTGFILFSVVILSLSMRGNKGNPTSQDLSNINWAANGPFELSPERGRFALMYSMVEDKSFYFSEPIAKFAAPDIGESNGHYVSLFAPLVSFIIIPGYLLGKIFGIGQVGAFTVIGIFALFNVILLRLIAIRLGAGKLPATIASFLFLFATPAFSYAVNLYQHHISTFLILLSIYLLLKSNKIWVLLGVFFLCAMSIPLDYPNAFLMFPIGLYALNRIISLKRESGKIIFNFSFVKFLALFIMILPLFFFFWFNKKSYDNPLQFSGTVKTAEFKNLNNVDNFNKKFIEKNISEEKGKSALGFFSTRDLLNGFYIHMVSQDRGIIYYAPVVLFGLAGMIFAIRKKIQMTAVLVAVLGMNILLYSMWGDPWGGWAFGSRYLIPTYAILSIFTAIAINRWGNKIIFVIPFILVSIYSVAVNVLGAITTSAMPPKIEVLALEKISNTVQKYDYFRNWDYLSGGNSKSFIYQTYLEKYISSVMFYGTLTISICIVLGCLIIYQYVYSRKGASND